MKRETYISKFDELKGRFGKGNCGYCGKKLKGRQRYWCEGTHVGSCVHAIWLMGKDWNATRRAVFDRDKGTCVKCGQKRNDLSNSLLRTYLRGEWKMLPEPVRLEADHIKPVELYPELQWDLNNLQTLCQFCHREKTKQDVRAIAAARRPDLHPEAAPGQKSISDF